VSTEKTGKINVERISKDEPNYKKLLSGRIQSTEIRGQKTDIRGLRLNPFFGAFATQNSTG
jgi:hypothetical protein